MPLSRFIQLRNSPELTQHPYREQHSGQRNYHLWAAGGNNGITNFGRTETMTELLFTEVTAERSIVLQRVSQIATRTIGVTN